MGENTRKEPRHADDGRTEQDRPPTANSQVRGVFAGGQGRGRTADLPIFSRTQASAEGRRGPQLGL